jgi:urea transport system substrate-binding protein
VTKSRTVKIGVLFSQSGPLEENGKYLVDATKVAVEEINKTGGLLGRTIEMIVEDGESKPAVFADRAKKLICEDHVATIFGCWTSHTRKAVKPVVEENQALLWYPVQYEGLEESPNIFYTGSSLNQQIEPAMEWANSEKKRTCILIGSDYVYPRVANKLIRTSFQNLGGKILTENYYPLDAEDFSEVISEVENLQPDMIFNTLNGNSNIHFFRQLARSQYDHKAHPIMSFSFSEIELSRLTDNEAEGSFACWSYFQSMENAVNKQFLAKFKQCRGDRKCISADPIVCAYSQVHLWKQAVMAAKTFDNREVKKASIGQQFQSPGGLLTIQPNHHVRKHAAIARVNPDNNFEVVWESKQPLDAKPWLNLEDIDFPNKRLAIEIMESYPEAIHTNWRLNLEIEKRKNVEAELLEAVDQSLKANDVKNNFIINLSHEIRTPMNAILGFAHILKPAAKDPETLYTLEQLQNSANSLMTVVNTIFDYSRMQTDELEIVEEEFNIYDLISILKQSFLERAQKKNIDLDFNVDERIDKELFGDSIKILQTLRGILDNAIKFTKKGAVTFSMDLLNENDESATIAFAISDTGIGMTRDQIDLVIKYATQVNDSSNREFGGLGLNLKLISKMIALMGGVLNIESELGKGSTFSFQLVLKKAARHEEASPELNLKDVHILVAEDNEINQLITRQVLENHKINVDIANNGLVAVEMAKSKKYDAILMDIQMPLMDGYEATKKLRAIGQYADTPIIALTANTMQEEIKKIKDVGMQAQLAKPLNPDALISALIFWLSKGQKKSIPTIDKEETSDSGLAGINSAAGLRRVNGDAHLYESLLIKFYENQQGFFSRYEKAISEGDFANAELLVHSLKGVAGNIGANDLFIKANVLDTSLKKFIESQNFKQKTGHLYDVSLEDSTWTEVVYFNYQALKNSLGIVLSAIETLISNKDLKKEKPAAKPGKKITPLLVKKIEPQLYKLKNLLVESSIDSDLVFKEILEIVEKQSVHSPTLDSIKNKMQNYDYESALELLDKFIQENSVDGRVGNE